MAQGGDPKREGKTPPEILCGVRREKKDLLSLKKTRPPLHRILEKRCWSRQDAVKRRR